MGISSLLLLSSFNIVFKSFRTTLYITKMVAGDKTEWKAKYFLKIQRLIEEYPRIFIVLADNVRSKQMQQIRVSLRGMAEILMGKNTMMCKAIRGEMANNPALEKLLPHI